MRFKTISLVTLLSVSFLCTSARAESKWSLKKILPVSFEKKSSVDLPDPIGSPPAVSPMKKMTSGTRNLFSKTKKAITPDWRMGGKKKKGATSKMKQSLTRVGDSIKAVPKKMFAPLKNLGRTEPKKPKTVNEFLSLPRPEY